MKTNVRLVTSPVAEMSGIFLVKDVENLKTDLLSTDEIAYVKAQKNNHLIDQFSFNRLKNWVFVKVFDNKTGTSAGLEKFRKAGDEFQLIVNKLKTATIWITSIDAEKEEVLAFTEGIVLGNYQFIRFVTDQANKANSLSEILVHSTAITKNDVDQLKIVTEAVCQTRDLVNLPASHLTAESLAGYFATLGEEAGVKTEIFEKKKIESIRMGGLLAVNKGSIDPPTFTVMEYKPENAVNSRPVVLVGKGIVFDTGGLNIKSGNFMENMKSDMAGAAMMASAICAVAKARLPLHVVALMPATDNRPDGNAFASGDVITMHNGQTVEIVNTDAEGRMILADALSYAQKFDPELVITSATLTGSAQRALGKYAAAAMQAKAPEYLKNLIASGDCVYERLVEFPMWEEYADHLKSEIADMKHLGIPEGGMIIAGKFLEKFTSYPFIHLDIAGVAFAEKRDSYRNVGGTGFGVRLLFDFLKNMPHS